jgi:hypothetical protein
MCSKLNYSYIYSNNCHIYRKYFTITRLLKTLKNTAMLHLLFYLLLQLGLLGDPSTPPPAAPDQVTTTETSTSTNPDVDLDSGSSATNNKLSTDVNIGGGGWDDKN